MGRIFALRNALVGMTLGFLPGLGLLGVSQAAHAQAADGIGRVALNFHDREPSPCLDANLLEHRVESQIGHAVFVAGKSADVQLDVNITTTSRNVQVELELSRRGESLGSRSLQGSTDRCKELLDSLVVVVALLVDVPRVEDSAPSPTPPPSELPKPAPTERVVRPPRIELSEANHAALGAQAIWVSGLLPGAAAGVGVDWRVAFGMIPWFSWRLGAGYLPRDRLTAEGGRVGFSAGWLQLGVAPLRFGSRTAFHVQPWLLLTMAAIDAHGRDFAVNHGGLRALPVVGPALGAELPLSSRVSLTAEAALDVALERPRILYRNPDGSALGLHRPGLLQPTGQLGAAWRF